MLSLQLVEKIAYSLKTSQEQEVAFFFADNSIFYARQAPLSAAPTSAVVKLIQGLYERDPAQARRLARNRIYFTGKSTVMCLGMVRVAAKRLTSEVRPFDHPLDSLVVSHLDRVELNPPFCFYSANEELKCSTEWMKEALNLAAKIPRDRDSLYDCDRPVAALLVSDDNQLLASAMNTNSRNRTLHAEVNLIQYYYQKYQRSLPKKTRIYTTLKPCKMCAGMIWNCAEDVTTLQVFYDQEDPGNNAKATVLDLGTFERELDCQIQFQLTCHF